MNHLTNWADLPDAVWDACLDRALWHGANRQWSEAARHKALGLLFFNPSLRTRTSMELAAAHLGAHPLVITPGQGVWGFEWREGVTMEDDKAEHIREAIGVLGRYVDALGVRTFAGLRDRIEDQSDRVFRSIVAASSVPVVNLESATWHPCQALADAATIRERFGNELSGKRFVLAWAYHPKALPQAVPNSALLMAARLGLDVTVAHPEGFDLDDDVINIASATAHLQGGSVRLTDDLDGALDGAHVVYAKAWSGVRVYDDPTAEAALRQRYRAWRITADRMARTDGAAFMHCLPVRRGVVVDGDVLDGPQAVHLTQAEYRLHAQKAVLEWVWESEGLGFGTKEPNPQP
jgi:N-acetylornithine carbamoyltransferase